MDTEYYIYSIKMNSWLTKSMTGTSSLKDAGKFSRDIALKYAKARNTPGLTVIITPVYIMQEIFNVG